MPHRRRIQARASLAYALLAVLSGCSDSSGPGAGSVATVVLTGVPTGPVLIGETVQLAATALNATGGTISDARFSWQSSDPTIAGVSPGGLVTILGAGAVSITAKAGVGTGTAELDARAGGTLTDAGGVLNLLNGAVVLTVPAGGVFRTTNLLVRPVPDPTQSPLNVPATIFEIGPEGTAFFGTLALRYESSRIPAGNTEATLQLYRLQQGNWALIQSSGVNAASRTVSGSIFGAGTYAVRVTGVFRIALAGALVDGGLYEGQKGQLSAEVFDSINNPLTGRTVIWSSSDPTRATVTNGEVTAVRQGTVSITARSEGKSASTSIMIAARPVADWSGVTGDWVTFQGNPEHTGFVAATLDPAVFAERWVRVVTGADVMNPVTFGPGMVFASTNLYFANQRLVAYDLAGTLKWTEDFGPIHGVHDPAYGDGTVYVTTSGHADSFLWAFDAANGSLRFKSPYANQWSRYYAPSVVGGSVFMAGGGGSGIYSFDGASGAERWFASTNQYDLWTPAVRNGVAYAYTGEYQPMVAAFDATTGAALFEIPDPNFSWDGWSMNTAPVLGGMNNLLAVQAGRLLSFDLSARNVRWQVPGGSGGFRGAVTVGPNALYLIRNGTLEARREADGTLMWSWSPPQGQLTGTTIATRNLVFASTATHTYAVDLQARRSFWGYPTGGALALSSQGVLVIAGSGGRVTAITVR